MNIDNIELMPCPQHIGFCHIEIIRTAEKGPRNIRIGCEHHGVWLDESFSTVNDAIKAWNIKMVEGKRI